MKASDPGGSTHILCLYVDTTPLSWVCQAYIQGSFKPATEGVDQELYRRHLLYQLAEADREGLRVPRRLVPHEPGQVALAVFQEQAAMLQESAPRSPLGARQQLAPADQDLLGGGRGEAHRGQ